MAKMGVTREKILEEAAIIADEKGFDAVSLKEIAEKLNIRPPTMFNHISSLQDLKEELCRFGAEKIKDDLIRAAFGKSGVDALREMARAYYAFAKSHPGVYAALQWKNIWKDEKHADFDLIIETLMQITADFGYNEQECLRLVRLYRSYLHGFADLIRYDELKYDTKLDESFERGLEIILNGVTNNKSL